MPNLWWAEINDLKNAKKEIVDTEEFAHDKELEDINFDNKIVLDFGCGVGRNLKYLVNTSAQQIIGFDFPNMIELSKQILSEDKRSKIQFISPPLQNLPKLDIIVATLVFQHVNDINELEAYLFILKEALSENGILYVNSRGYIDIGADPNVDRNVWHHILNFFDPITNLDDSDGSELHQKVFFRRKL
jgi:cyclopropane fatty-acyl-phospholipid synthase-like methyltransferase